MGEVLNKECQFFFGKFVISFMWYLFLLVAQKPLKPIVSKNQNKEREQKWNMVYIWKI